MQCPRINASVGHATASSPREERPVARHDGFYAIDIFDFRVLIEVSARDEACCLAGLDDHAFRRRGFERVEHLCKFAEDFAAERIGRAVGGNVDAYPGDTLFITAKMRNCVVTIRSWCCL